MLTSWHDYLTKGVDRSSTKVDRINRKTQEQHMPKSVNKVILVGNAGKDAEIKYTASGIAVAKFNPATNESFKDKSGEWQNRAEWPHLLAHGSLSLGFWKGGRIGWWSTKCLPEQ
jgi:hypothetical protein